MTSERQLFVRNLPYRAADQDLITAFSQHGEVKRAFVVLDPVTKSSRGFGYITFTTPEEAKKAVRAKVEIFGREVQCKWADKLKHDDKQKPKRARKAPDDDEEDKKTPQPTSTFKVIEGEIAPTKSSEFRRCIAIKITDVGLYDALKLAILSKLVTSKLVTRVQPPVATNSDKAKPVVLLECPTRAAAVDCYMQLKEFRESDSIKFTFSYLEKKPSLAVEESKPEPEPIKEEPVDVENEPTLRDIKQHRLILRNLPFKATEKSLKESLSPFGEVMEIVLPKKPDGQIRGFAFVQFVQQPAAAKALEKLNMTKIGGRVVAIDWAVPKGVYDFKVSGLEENLEAVEVKMEVDSVVEDENQLNNENDNSSGPPTDPDAKQQEKVKPKPPPSHDIGEGRTVFVRGVAFSTDEGTLLSTFENLFGSVYYAKVCMDESGRSKGTAFVKFIHKDHAEECVKKSAESPLILDGRRLDVTMALDRKAAENARTENAKLKEANDPRNLRLAPLGFIRQGTKDAEGLSNEDLQKRKLLQSGNISKLRNPAMFVSDTRLSVHNIPATIDDKKLREIVLKAVEDKTAKIVECRIMRDRDRPNASGVGKSKGFAFVAFKEHKHALAALQKLNNNPDYFSDKKRLIVQFSIENRTALVRKQQSLEKSREQVKHTGGDTAEKAPKKKKFWKHKRSKKTVVKPAK